MVVIVLLCLSACWAACAAAIWYRAHALHGRTGAIVGVMSALLSAGVLLLVQSAQSERRAGLLASAGAAAAEELMTGAAVLLGCGVPLVICGYLLVRGFWTPPA